jgi:hypothetical protein
MGNGQAPLLRCNRHEPQELIKDPGKNILGGYNGLPNPRCNKSGVDSIDGDVEIFRMPEKSSLQLRNPHLVVELVVLIIVAFHIWAAIKMIDIKKSEMVDA